MNSPLEIAANILGGIGGSDWLWAIHEPAMSRVMSRQRIINVDAVVQSVASSRPRTEGSVGVIPISGVMYKEAYYSDEASISSITNALRVMAADENVSSILLVADSPGGSVSGLAELSDAVSMAASKKPVIGQVVGMCASACYYALAGAQQIFAQRMDTIGSIGTRLNLWDWSQLFQNVGLTSVTIDTGPYKSTGAMGKPVTDDQKQYLQSIVDGYQADFAQVVQAGRKMSPERFAAVADGRVFLASEAKSLGLIDGIQTYDQTLSQLAALAAPKTGVKKMTDTTTPTKVAATFTELKSCIPGVTAEFICESQEKGHTLDQAQSTWMELQQKQVADLNQKLADAQKVKEAAGGAGVPAGTVAEGGKGGPKEPESESTGGAFTERVAKLKAAGKSPADAMRQAVKEDPEGHEAYLEEYNATHETMAKAKERFAKSKK